MAAFMPRAYTHPDAQRLLHLLYDEQVGLYGHADHPDATPAAAFDPPAGLFVVVYDQVTPIGCGGWRHLPSRSRLNGPAAGYAEIKRLFVAPSHRGRGLARALLDYLEQDAARAGAVRLVLETGAANTAALGLFRSAGWAERASYVPGRDPVINRALTKELTRHRHHPGIG